MQFLLTQEEYDTLKRWAEYGRSFPAEQVLQDTCTKIADTMPIEWPWGVNNSKGTGPKPWGCIITRNKNEGNEWYCDSCPVRALCRYPHKNYSK